jgi:hypothetical protein
MPITAYDTTFRGLGLLTISILPFLCLLQPMIRHLEGSDY